MNLKTPTDFYVFKRKFNQTIGLMIFFNTYIYIFSYWSYCKPFGYYDLSGYDVICLLVPGPKGNRNARFSNAFDFFLFFFFKLNDWLNVIDVFSIFPYLA